jgi:hypothetical protein
VQRDFMPRLNLDLREPLASDFDAYCNAMGHDKTKLLRKLVEDYLGVEMKTAGVKKRIAEWRRTQSKSKNN